MSEPKHPYRSPVELVEEVARRPGAFALLATQGRVIKLKHALDEGNNLEVLALAGRAWLADRIRDMEANARFIRRVAGPLSMGFGWAAASLVSFAVLGALYRVHHGGQLVSIAVSIAVTFALFSLKARQWIPLADEIDTVVKDLREFCRKQEVTLSPELAERVAQHVRKVIARDGPVELPEPTGVRVDPADSAPDTPADEAPQAPEAILTADSVTKRRSP